MSLIHAAAITAVAHSVDVPGLTDEAAKTLAPDVEYRLREIVQVLAPMNTEPEDLSTCAHICPFAGSAEVCQACQAYFVDSRRCQSSTAPP